LIFNTNFDFSIVATLIVSFANKLFTIIKYFLLLIINNLQTITSYFSVIIVILNQIIMVFLTSFLHNLIIHLIVILYFSIAKLFILEFYYQINL